MPQNLPMQIAANDPLALIRRNASQTVASSFQLLHSDPSGGQIYNRSNTTLDSLSTPFGYQAIASGNRSVAFGAFAYAKEDSAVAVGVYSQAFGPSSIAIGDQAKATVYRSIAIGPFANATGIRSIAFGVLANSSGRDGVAVGTSASCTAADGVAVGNSALVSASKGLAVGDIAQVSGANAVAVGYSAVAAFLDSIALGPNAVTSAAQQFVSGCSTNTITDIYFGSGPQSISDGTDYTIHGSEAEGRTDKAGGDVTVAGGRSTGSGVGGSVIIRTANTGASSSSFNALVNRIIVDAPGNVVLNGAQAALATNATDGFTYIPTCAGAPSGTPTSKTGAVPMVFDTTNNKLMIYDGGWIGVTLS